MNKSIRSKSTSRGSLGRCNAHLTRHSRDDAESTDRCYLVATGPMLQHLLETEDTTGDKHITIDDQGPNCILIGSLSSAGHLKYELRGTYALSSLLQKLTIAIDQGSHELIMDHSDLHENPVQRLRRQVTNVFWPGLTRRLDADVVGLATRDTKVPTTDGRPRIYVPCEAHSQLNYYQSIAESRAELNLQVVPLPSVITTETYRTLVDKPGLLALDTEDYVDPITGKTESHGVPFIVPGGRFNEFFGWDSHFIGLGLIADGRYDLVGGIIRNWIFEIQHYGLIPNANRSYFLLRSQPPFVTDLSLRLYNATRDEPGAKALLHRGIQAAIKEYHTVWVTPPRLDELTCLSKYRPAGVGIPIEVEKGHFDHVLSPFAEKHGVSVEEYTTLYNQGVIYEPDLERFLQHDRGLRESGHDTSFRLENRAGDLAIIDLNFLLYKYETDIAYAIETIFEDDFQVSAEFTLPSSGDDASSSVWKKRSEDRKAAINKYFWNEERGMYLDYDVREKKQIEAESVTCLWALSCGVASPHQAELLVSRALPRFECRGGLSASSRHTYDMATGHRFQWDYPFGWAPHQMMAWDGLVRYGYRAEAARLAYRWVRTILKVYVDYHGAVCEKYNVVRERAPHQVEVEYGNQGADFDGYPREGFGWTNASFVYGLSFLNRYMERALAVCAEYEVLARSMSGDL